MRENKNLNEALHEPYQCIGAGNTVVKHSSELFQRCGSVTLGEYMNVSMVAWTAGTVNCPDFFRSGPGNHEL